MWTTVLEYATPILTAVGFGSGWLIGKYTFVGLQNTITTEINTLKSDVTAIKAKLP